MQPVRFRLEEHGSGWQVRADRPVIGAAVEHAVVVEAGLGDLPPDLALVGHLELGDRWCVFVREPGMTAVNGVLLEETDYLDRDLDPFATGAFLLGSTGLRDVVEGGVLPKPSGSLANLVPASGRPEYLRYAYGFFLAGHREARRGFYCSVLPPHKRPPDSPLTCFAPPERPPETRTMGVPQPDARPVSREASLLPEEPFAVHREAEGETSVAGEVFAAPEEPSPIIDDTAGAGPEAKPSRARSRDISEEKSGGEHATVSHGDGLEADWSAIELEKSDLEVADEQAPQVEEPTPVVGPDDPEPDVESSSADIAALEAGLAVARKTLGRRTAVLWSVIVAMAIVAGVGFGYLYQRLQHEIARLDTDKVDMTAMVDGLGLTTEGRTAAESLRAKLRDMATSSIQSGAWQEGLKSRGTTSEEFLDHLVALSEVHDSLLKLARAETGLLRLARVVNGLEPLADRRDLVVALTEHSDALTAVAGVQQDLVELAARRRALGSLADRKSDLEVLAGMRPDLVALTSQRRQLEETVLRAATFETMSREVANVLTFMERRQRDLDRLASRSGALLELVDSSALADVSRRQEELKRLLDRSEALGELADDVARLRALSANADELVVMARAAAARR